MKPIDRKAILLMVAIVLGVLSFSCAVSGGGLSVRGNQLWDQDSPGIQGTAGENDLFGYALATGDFNADGHGDMAVGVPHEEISTKVGGVWYTEEDAGAVNVLYGSARGLSEAGNQLWHRNVTGVEGVADDDDEFGLALAVGDFNGDGYDDLAIGVPYDDVDGTSEVGSVNILYGLDVGLSATNDQIWHQGSTDILGFNDPNDHYGEALGAGDFNGDGYADLAVGVPGEDAAGKDQSGRVNVLYGSASGLSAAGNQTWQEGSGGLLGLPMTNEHFGRALAAGNFNGDQYDDLAVGVPGESGPVDYSGSVYTLYGSAGGLTATGHQIWAQDDPDIGGDLGEDGFGQALATGDFNGDGYDDLAAGAPWEDIETKVGTKTDAGAVNVLYGSASGLTATVSQFWHQNSPGVQGTAASPDMFGSALASGDFDGDGCAELAVGAPNDDDDGGPSVSPGVVNVLYGSSAGLTAMGNQLWHQNVEGVLGTAEGIDWFGNTLGTGDFNGNRCADLAVGIPEVYHNGEVLILYGYPDTLPWLFQLLLYD